MDEINVELEKKKLDAFRLGLAIIILLSIFTLGEFFIGSVAVDWWAPLIGIAILKAFFVVRDYMHLPRLFAGEEEVH